MGNEIAELTVTERRYRMARVNAPENWHPGLRDCARPGWAVPGMIAAKRGPSVLVLDRPAPQVLRRIEPGETKADPHGAA
jgi:hypothetical protein